MRRRTFLRSLAASPLAALGIGQVAAGDSQLESGTWYDATVTDVTDGDTMDVVLDSDGTEYEIRHLGLDTPETKSNSRYEEVREWEGIEDDTYLSDWGERAKEYAQEEFPDGTNVQIAVDEREEEVDPFGRLLAYVRYDKSGDGSLDTLYNLDVVRQGYARVYSSSLTRHDEFWQAERDARDQGLRVWQQSDPENTSEVGNDPVSTVYFPNASSVRTSDGAIADSRVPVYAEASATQDRSTGAVDYDRIPMVGVDESTNVALVGGLFVNESNEGDAEGEHRVFLSNLIDDLSSRTGQVLVEGGHRQFNAQYGLSCEDTVVYQRFLEGVGVNLEGVNSVDGSGDNALSTARGVIVTTAQRAFSASEVDALSTYLDNGGSVVLMGSALATSTERTTLDDLAAGLGTDLRLNEDQVFDNQNNTGDAAFVTTSDFDTSFPLFDSYTPDTSTDGAPSVSWVTPSGGDTVSGTVTVQVNASDSEDSDDSLTVTYTVDGGSERATTYNATSGYYEDSWDTTAVADGDHTLSATATDSAGNASSSSVTVTTDNTESAPVVDSLSASEVETSDSDAEFDASWQVSDGDGNLSEVDLALSDDTDDETEDTASVSVSGDTASGTTRLVAGGDDGSGNSYTVEATVTDGADNTDSATATVTESDGRSDVLTADPSTAGADSFHTWTLADPAFSGSVGTVTVDYPSGTSLDGLTNDDVFVYIDTDGDGTAEEVRVNSDSYAGSTATFDLDGRYDTTVAGEVRVEVDGVTNPAAGEYVATETLSGDDTLSVDAEYVVTASALAVATGAASDVTDSSATLSGSLDDLGGASSADCYFEYRQTGASSWTATAAQTLSSTGSFTESVASLDTGTEYEFRAVASGSDGDTDTGSAVTFTTSNAASAPAVDSVTVTDRSNPQWDRYDVDWTVSDGDGDLSRVTTEMLDASGTGLDSDADTVSGDTASGSHSVRSKATASEVVLTVTDAAGNAASVSRSV